MQTIKLIEISKSFKSKKALNNVNIEFKSNRINGLLGPNGSGKTTLFNIVLEDSLGGGAIREETTTTRAANIILEDNLNSTGNFSILLETGDQVLKEGTDTVDISQSEVYGGSFLLEMSTIAEYCKY